MQGVYPAVSGSKIYRFSAGGVRHDPQRVLGKSMEMAHLPLVTIE